MRRLLWLPLLAGLAASGCSDIHLLRKARGAYDYAEVRYESRCVQIAEPRAPEDCLEEQQRLERYYQELAAAQAAMASGPLPKQARTRLKSIRKELE